MLGSDSGLRSSLLVKAGETVAEKYGQLYSTASIQKKTLLRNALKYCQWVELIAFGKIRQRKCFSLHVLCLLCKYTPFPHARQQSRGVTDSEDISAGFTTTREPIFSEEIFRRNLQMVHIIFHCYEVSYEAAQNELNRLRDLAPCSKFVFEDAVIQTDANK